jgi:hypothetical protein
MNGDLERELKHALARKPAPPNFEARVLQARALAAASKENRRAHWRWFPAWAPAVLAAILIVSGATWLRHRETQRRAAGEDAKARLELALRFVSVKLRKIQQEVEAVE